jgi:hypothetical protein
MKNIRSNEALKQILNSKFTRIKANYSTQDVSTKWLGYLVMESLCAYRDNPSAFGQESRSFDAVIKKFVDDNVGSKPRATRVKNLNRILDSYRRPRGPRQRLALKRVGRSSGVQYLGRKGRAIFSHTAADLFVKRINGKRILPAGVALPDGPAITEFNHRNIQGDLKSVYCANRSETSTDEIYLLTGAVLFDKTGTWKTTTDYMPDSDEDVSAGNEVEFPEDLNPLFFWNIVKPPDGTLVSPKSTACTVTIMEEDQSNRQRIVSAYQAAYTAGKLLSQLAAGSAGGPFGIAIAVVNILILLLLALDGDDELGTAAFRFDNLLTSDVPADFDRSFAVSGSQKGNSYRYIVKVRYRAQDFFAPKDYSCRIDGPSSLTLQDPGKGVKGRYKVHPSSIGNVQPSIESIKWSVTPHAGTSVAPQGTRSTYIKFRHTGTFVIKVTAKVEGTSTTVTDTHRVGVDKGNIIHK